LGHIWITILLKTKHLPLTNPKYITSFLPEVDQLLVDMTFGTIVESLHYTCWCDWSWTRTLNSKGLFFMLSMKQIQDFKKKITW